MHAIAKIICLAALSANGESVYTGAPIESIS